MAPQTVLQALTARNPTVDIQLLSHGSNTQTPGSLRFQDWEPWPEFEYPILSRIFDSQLKKTYHADPIPKPLPADLRLCNKDMVETLLVRHIMPVVNFALNEQSVPTHFGKGSRCGV